MGTGGSKEAGQANQAAAKTPYGKDPSKKSLQMAKRGESAKSHGANILSKNLNMDSAQPGESQMTHDSAALERMQSHQ